MQVSDKMYPLLYQKSEYHQWFVKSWPASTKENLEAGI